MRLTLLFIAPMFLVGCQAPKQEAPIPLTVNGPVIIYDTFITSGKMPERVVKVEWTDDTKNLCWILEGAPAGGPCIFYRNWTVRTDGIQFTASQKLAITHIIKRNRTQEDAMVTIKKLRNYFARQHLRFTDSIKEEFPVRVEQHNEYQPERDLVQES